LAWSVPGPSQAGSELWCRTYATRLAGCARRPLYAGSRANAGAWNRRHDNYFSAVDALLLRSLPFPDQNRLAALSTTYATFPRAQGPVSATDVAHWRADNRVFEQIECASWPDMVAMSSPGYAERVGVQHVSVRLFSLLGIKTFLGTLPTDALSEKRGSDGVAISYEFWQHHFGSDPNVLRRSVFVDTAATTVVAILSPGFNLFGTGVPEVYFIHGMADPADSGIDDPRFMIAIGKLKPGVSVEQSWALFGTGPFRGPFSGTDGISPNAHEAVLT
jgi:putative ABC transport system permease protein